MEAEKDVDWFIIEGCWHAFHTTCICDVSFCPLCRAHLKAEITRLAEAANTSMFGHPIPDESKNYIVKEDQRDPVAACINEITEEMCWKKIEAASTRISQLTPVRPQGKNKTSKLDTVIDVKKPPHCRRCMHTTRSHRGKGKHRECDKCPNKGFSVEGSKIPCSCGWHRKIALSRCKIYQEEISVSKIGNVSEIVLPRRCSQSGLVDDNTGINSCCVITILCQSTHCRQFLKI